MQEFCVGQPYKISTMQYWEKRLRHVDQSKAPAAISASAPPTVPIAPAFVPRMAPVIATVRDRNAAIVVDIADARIAVRHGFDAELLGDVVRALRGAQ